MPLPLTVSCFSKIQIDFTFLVPAHLGSPGKGLLNGCVCVIVSRLMFDTCAIYVILLTDNQWSVIDRITPMIIVYTLIAVASLQMHTLNWLTSPCLLHVSGTAVSSLLRSCHQVTWLLPLPRVLRDNDWCWWSVRGSDAGWPTVAPGNETA